MSLSRCYYKSSIKFICDGKSYKTEVNKKIIKAEKNLTAFKFQKKLLGTETNFIETEKKILQKKLPSHCSSIAVTNIKETKVNIGSFKKV